MILPREDIAWIKDSNGAIAPFDGARLARSVQRAAAQVGHGDWWLAESVASALHTFACESSSARTMTAREVAEMVAEVLAMLGFPEIARAYESRARYAEIRLDEMAARSEAGFELEFFRRLDAALGPAALEETMTLQVGGLRSCVMRLRGARRWGAGCRTLAEDIVDYVRERAVRLRPAQACALQLAVLE